MAQAYTAPDWASGEGISPSNLQSISNVLEGIVQGTDRAIHGLDINGNVLTVTYVDGSIENFTVTGLKGIADVSKTRSGNVDTYTITYTDGTTYSFEVINGGGGGTDVQWNQETTEGTKIAEITIDGETTEVFAPNGGGVDVVEITKEEYDALPDSKLTDNIPRYIKDYSEGSSMNAYELEEKEIGTCLGKTLYRQGYQCDIALSSSTSTLAIKKSDWDIEQILNAVWIRVSPTKGGCARPQVWCDGDSLKIDNTSSYGLSSGEHSYLWLEYTKVGG